MTTGSWGRGASGPGRHRLLEVPVERLEELLGGEPRGVATDEEGEVLGHVAALDRADAHVLERVGEAGDVGRAVEPGPEGEGAGPGEDRRDRVRRRLLALLPLAEVAGDRAVGGLGLARLAVGREEDGRHQAQRAEALGDR